MKFIRRVNVRKTDRKMYIKNIKIEATEATEATEAMPVRLFLVYQPNLVLLPKPPGPLKHSLFGGKCNDTGVPFIATVALDTIVPFDAIVLFDAIVHFDAVLNVFFFSRRCPLHYWARLHSKP